MLPVRTILCPTDFSEPAEAAIAIAAELAGHFASELVLLHVVAPPTPVAAEPAFAPGAGFDQVAHQGLLVRNAEERLRALGDRLAPGARLRARVSVGRPGPTILAVADRETASLIVIATHGRTGVRRLLFGSVAEKVVRHAPCPVLTVRTRPVLRYHEPATPRDIELHSSR